MILRSTNKKISFAIRAAAGSVALAFLCLMAGPIQAATLSVLNIPANSSGEDIQKALDELAGGGEVVLAPGTYEIHRPIVLRHSYQTLRGGGPGTILVLADNANCPVVIMGAPSQATARTTEHLRLADLQIDGNRTNQQQELWRVACDGSLLNNNGVDIWGVNDAVVENVACYRCRSGGLVAAQARRIDVRNFTAFDNQYDGLACYFTEESHFSGLRLHDNLAAGISLDLSFQHNVIEDAVLERNDLGIFMRDSRDNVFQGLNIENSHTHGVFIAESGSSTPEGWKLDPSTACTGNQFVAPVVTNCGGYGILINDASCTNNVVTDARFVADTRGGLYERGHESTGTLAAAIP